MRAATTKGCRAAAKTTEAPGTDAIATKKVEKGIKRRADSHDAAEQVTAAAPAEADAGDASKASKAKSGKLKRAKATAGDAAAAGDVTRKGSNAPAGPDGAKTDAVTHKNSKLIGRGAAAADGDEAATASAKPVGRSSKKQQQGQGKKRAAEAEVDAEAAAKSDGEGGGDAEEEEDEGDGAVAAVPKRGRGGGASRRATQRVKSYKEEDDKDVAEEDEEMEETMEVVKVKEAATEEEALRLTDPGVSAGGSNAGGSGSGNGAMRRLVDFKLVNSKGQLEPVEQIGKVEGGVFICGSIEALAAPMAGGGKAGKAKAKAKGAAAAGARCRVTSVGPIREWRIQYHESAAADPQLILRTDHASYECCKPAAQYRQTLDQLTSQLAVAGAVHWALCPAANGSLDASLQDVCRQMTRTLPKVCKQYGGAHHVLLLNGRFVAEQLTVMAAGSVAAAADPKSAKGKEVADKGKSPATCTYDNGPFARDLKAELAENGNHLPVAMESLAMLMGAGAGGGGGGGIRIATDGGSGGGQDGGTVIDEDEELARRLQAEELNAHLNGGGYEDRGRRRGGGGGRSHGGRTYGRQNPYIQVREVVIAEDYPAPKEYVVDEDADEWDELVREDVGDLGCGRCNDELEARTLDDFAIYNSEGMLAPLELVPMEADLDIDCNIFASGIMAADKGPWSDADEQSAAAGSHHQQHGDGAGGSGAGGSGASGSGAGGSGSGAVGGDAEQRYYLTQIREWLVECGPDGLTAIKIRTDVAWYRLLRPQKRYKPWYRVVQRATAVAIHILAKLDEQDRASKLSFNDIVNGLAKLPKPTPDQPGQEAWISDKPDAVARFVVAHGAVILTLLGGYKAGHFRNCGFAKTLRAKMSERPHRDLMTTTGKGAKGAAATRGERIKVQNPVQKLKGERKKKGKPEQMPATTTDQVKSIWADYYNSVDVLVGGQQEQQQQEEKSGTQEIQAATGAAAAAASGSAAAAVGGGAGGAAGSSGASGAGAAAVAGTAAPSTAVLRVPEVTSKTWTLSEPLTAAADKDKSVGRTLYGAAVCGDLRLSHGSIIRLGPGGGGGDDTSEDESSNSEEEEEEEDKQESESDRGAGGDGSGSGGGAAANGACETAAAKAAKAAARRMAVLTRGPFGMVQCIYQDTNDNSPKLQVRRMVHGRDTVLGNVAAPSELFLLDRTPMLAVPASRGGQPAAASASAPAPGDVLVLSLKGRSVAEVLEAKHLSRNAQHTSRLEDAKADKERLARDAERVAAGQPPLFVYRSVYCPLQGKFRELRLRDLGLGSYVQEAPLPPALALLPGGAGFIKDGVTYRVGDFLYVPAEALGQHEEEEDSSDSGSDAAEDEFDSDGRDEFVDEDAEEDEDVRDAARRGRRLKSAKRGDGAKKGASAAAKAGGDAAAKGRSKKGAKAKAADKKDDEEEMDEEESEGQQEEGEEAGEKRRKATGRRSTHKGSNEGMKPLQVVQLLGVEVEEAAAAAGAGGARKSKAAAAAAKAAGGIPSTIHVRRFYRPEDVSRDVQYRSDWWDLYAPALASDANGKASGSNAAAAATALELAVEEVRGKCAAIVGRPRPKSPKLDTFMVVGSYDPTQRGKTGPPPDNLAPPSAQPQTGAAAAAGGGSSKSRKQQPPAAGAAAAAAEEQQQLSGDVEADQEEGAAEWASLDSMDIFAGCGGLSEGMHQAGVARTRWAIEFDEAAAEAFKLNNPEAKVFANNCNVLLAAAMFKANQADDCRADPRVVEAVKQLDEAVAADLPAPGEVGFMMGGPPCQGYSGMNRHNGRLWSQMQNTMVMGYLSYCDFYRPRYFLLENVRNFVCYRGGEVFRLVVRTLLDIGYQVRFGILNAGLYGVPQSRKRTFIWAARPGELLPDWPTPRHVFSTAQLGVRMQQQTGGAGPAGNPPFFFAVGAPADGAPLRPVTVRDAIWDLPAVDNDAKAEQLKYTGEPQSAYQRYLRDGAGDEIRNHIVRQLNALNLERCRCIPKNKPGADWRELEALVARDPSREFFNGESLVPFCLPNTAHRHNGWRGLYGRLDPEGHFPTATTDPYPMGKVGQVLHPTQDRIVSVLECARSQGFPDRFHFFGDVSRRHRQVGNAVPPPLARALGQQLRLALKERRARDTQEADEQMQALRARRQQQQLKKNAK